MLPLDSSRWFSLTHAYGVAAEDTSAPRGWSASGGFHDFHEIVNVVACLRQLESLTSAANEGGREPWDTLISSLCHQGTIYSASFAAVPHIIRIGLRAAEDQEEQIAMDFFLLPTLIEQSRLEGQHPETPADIFEDYLASLPRLHDLAYAVRKHPWDHSLTAIISSSLAAANGHLQLSKCLLECNDEPTVKRFFSWFYDQS